MKFPHQRESMENYKILGRIGEGAHGIVLKARHIQVHKDIIYVYILFDFIQTGELVALKRVHLKKPKDGIPNVALRYTLLLDN